MTREEAKVGEVFKYNGVTLITIENNSCEGCFFNDGNICTREDELIFCSAGYRNDNKNVIFKEMEERTVKLTLEKAKKFYKKGGEFKDLALSAYTEEELTKVELPKTWEEFCNNYKVQKEECFIASNSVIANVSSSDRRLIYSDQNLLPNEQAAEAHLALIKLHQLRDCYRQGWKPDWTIPKSNFAIFYMKGKYTVEEFIYSREFLTFQTREIASKFLTNFRELIEEAGDLI